MSPALRFPDTASLHAALAQELIPKAVQTRPMRWERHGPAVVVQGSDALDDEALERLGSMGVTVVDQQPQRDGLCWAQALPLRPAGSESRGWFLLTTADRDAIHRFVRDAMSLGSHTLLLRYGEPHAVRIYDPSYFLILRAREEEVFRVFQQRDDGNWQAVGWTHPLSSIQVAGADSISFSADQTWHPVPAAGWVELSESITIEVEQAEPCASGEPEAKIHIPLQLVPSREPRSPRLWLLPISQRPHFERWTAALPQAQLQGLSFAILDPEGEALIALRADHHLEPPGNSRAYAPVDEDASIYLPMKTSINPPLSWEQLATAVGLGSQELIWLERGETHARVRRVQAEAFHPLADWVSYVIDQEQEPIKAWLKGIDPLLEPSLSREPSHAPTPSKPDPEMPAESAAAEPAQPSAPADTEGEANPQAPRPSPIGTQQTEMTAPRPTLYRDDPVWTQALTTVEEQLRQRPDEASLWTELATLQAGAGQEEAAIQSLSRAWWPLAPEERLQAATQWLQGLAPKAPTRRWSAIIAQTDSKGTDDWLRANRDSLDVRSVWLARLALVGAQRCDRLALHEEQDYLLGRIRHGLSRTLDLPAFLLSDSASTSATAQRSRALERLWAHFESTPRQPHPAEEAPENTAALIKLVFGYGHGCLGENSTAQSRVKEARLVLSEAQADPLIRILCHSYTERVELALAGRSTSVPLQTPRPLAQALNGIEAYHYAQWLERSMILDPLRSIDPQQTWQRGRGEKGPEDEILSEIIGATPTLNRIIGVPQGEGLERLREFIANLRPESSLSALFRAYACANAWDRPSLADQARTPLSEGIAAAEDPDLIADLARELPALMRFGGEPGAAELLTQLKTSAQSPCAKLYIEASLAVIGHENQALPMARAALDQLEPELPIAPRLDWIRAICEAIRSVDIKSAAPIIGRLTTQRPLIHDNHITNAYYSAAAVEFSECLVLAILGPGYAGNQPLLDAEESEIRGQIDKDTRISS